MGPGPTPLNHHIGTDPGLTTASERDLMTSEDQRHTTFSLKQYRGRSYCRHLGALLVGSLPTEEVLINTLTNVPHLTFTTTP